MLSPMRTADGRRTCVRSEGRSSARSACAARRWRPRWAGWRPTGCSTTVDGARPKYVRFDGRPSLFTILPREPPPALARVGARSLPSHEEPALTQLMLERAVARSTGESLATVRRLGFSPLTTGPESEPDPEDLRLALDCPFCGG